jgi:hypothetical protein
MILYPQFYRKYGIRRTDQFLQPPMPLLTRLELPRKAIYHYIGMGPLDPGPSQATSLFHGYSKTIYMQNIVQIGDFMGNPRRMTVDVNRAIRAHRSHNPRIRPLRALDTVLRDDATLLVYNYAFMARLYKYLKNRYTEYFRWHNIAAAVWKQVIDSAINTDRHQFIEMELPQVLPSLVDMRMAERGLSQKMARIFNSGEMLGILEIWTWLGVNREKSLLAGIPADRLHTVNVILKDQARWTVMNLGVLDGWRASTKEEAQELGSEEAKSGFDGSMMQKRFLRTMMRLTDTRSSPEIEENLDETEPTDDLVVAGSTIQSGDIINAVRPSSPMPSMLAPSPGKMAPVVVEKSPQQPAGTQMAVTPNLVAVQRKQDIYRDAADEAKIEKDLEQLEAISVQAQALRAKTEAAASHGGDATANDTAPADEEDQDESGDGSQSNPEEPLVVVDLLAPRVVDLDDTVRQELERRAEDGYFSAGELRRYSEKASTYRKIPSPDGKTTLGEFIKVPKELVALPESPSVVDRDTIIDKTMVKNSLLVFDSNYTKHVLQKDVAAMALNVQRAGVIVSDYNVEEHDDITGGWTMHTLKISPLEGADSTIRFRIPKVDNEGNFKVNGVNYRMRKQRGDLPIRKLSPDRVALTSYYGKVFVERNAKKVNDYSRWLRESIIAIGLDEADTRVTDLMPRNCFDNQYRTSYDYGCASMAVESCKVTWMRDDKPRTIEYCFDYKQRKELYGENVDELESNYAATACGKMNGRIAFMRQDGNVFLPANDTLPESHLGTLVQQLGIASRKNPLEFVELKVFGKNIPTGFVLGYLMGMDKLLASLKVKPKIFPTGQRPPMADDEWRLVFADETWVFSRKDRMVQLVMGGMREFEDSISNYSAHEFNRRDVYFNVLEESGLGVRYLREIDMLDRMFVDPITQELLLEMKEPTDMKGLIYRSVELLQTNHHPDEFDTRYMRIKGYERFAGAVYSELVQSLRMHNAKAGKARFPVEMNPYAVWIAINQDPAKNQVMEINPIQNLKEMEAVTYSGTGGRGSRSMTLSTRVYHKSDMGTISESTVDSSDVAINTFLSGDPQFTSLRGVSRDYVVGKTGATALLSTSALVSPGATNDDPKRVNFIAIQHSHGVACEGYHQPQVRTGYEQVIPQRTGDLFSVTAKQAGKVISRTGEGIIFEYADGTRQGVELGRRYGNAAGLVIPHSIVSGLQEGDKFKSGDAIAFNAGFFEHDVLNPGHIIWKSSMSVTTALMESADTLEDSSAISQRLSQRLSTAITKVRTVVVNFSQVLHKVVKTGEVVTAESILCIIEDAVSAQSNLLDAETIDTLRSLSSQAPQAKAKGVVERIEVYYHGDKEDMSESLRLLAGASDKELSKRNKSTGKPIFTGSVSDNFRIDNEPLPLDTAAIQVYITTNVASGVGDKGVFGNQMKTVHGRVFGDNVRTASGQKIDAIFGQKSIADRIVLSPELIGTTTTLLNVLAKRAVAAYKT